MPFSAILGALAGTSIVEMIATKLLELPSALGPGPDMMAAWPQFLMFILSCGVFAFLYTRISCCGLLPVQ